MKVTICSVLEYVATYNERYIVGATSCTGSKSMYVHV